MHDFTHPMSGGTSGQGSGGTMCTSATYSLRFIQVPLLIYIQQYRCRLIDLNPQSLCVLRLCILFDCPKEPLSKWIDWIKCEWVSRSAIKCLPIAIPYILAIENWYFKTKRRMYFWVASSNIVPEVVFVFSKHGLHTLTVWANAWIVWLSQKWMSVSE